LVKTFNRIEPVACLLIFKADIFIKAISPDTQNQEDMLYYKDNKR